MASASIVDVSAEVQEARAAARAEVEAVFAGLLAWLTPAGDQRRLWEVEQGLWERVWSLGRALVVLWLAHRLPCVVPRTSRGPDGRFYRWHGSRGTCVKTMFGEVPARREFYVIGDGKRGDTYAPLDRELGLQPTGFSLRTIGLATFLCAKMSFGEARGTLQRFWGWAPATKSLHKMVDQVGPLARPFLEGLPAPTEDGEYVFVLADSKGAPMITDTEMSRRPPGASAADPGAGAGDLPVQPPRPRCDGPALSPLRGTQWPQAPHARWTPAPVGGRPRTATPPATAARPPGQTRRSIPQKVAGDPVCRRQ
jgi:hypothetical protein